MFAARMTRTRVAPGFYLFSSVVTAFYHHRHEKRGYQVSVLLFYIDIDKETGITNPTGKRDLYVNPHFFTRLHYGLCARIFSAGRVLSGEDL
jgi:hypothetical protein